jgi:geranylgeranyl diphosphate synthase type II
VPSSSNENDAIAILREHGDALNAYLDALLNRYDVAAPPRLLESMRYSLMAGGKRLRPTLVMECWHACCADASSPRGRASALASAAAMELIHTFSLVHDDLPAMDDDDLRRGRPTNHKVYGEAMAILAGDAMVTMAFEAIATDAEPAVAPALVRELASASGPIGMIGGQVLDIDGEKQSLSLGELQRIHRMKTGALLTASCRLGAISAGADAAKLSAITEFGRHLGLAFQIVDDVLDVTSTAEQLGKATNKDAAKGKNTYPSLLGIEESARLAKAELEAALAAINPLGGRAARLKILAEFVVDRRV